MFVVFFSVCVLVCGKIETLGKTLPFILVKKGVHEPKAQTDGTYSGFLSRPRSITAPVDGTLVHRRDPLQQHVPGYHLCLHLGEEGDKVW